PSEPVLETITSPIQDDDTGGGSFPERPPSPSPATPTHSPTVGVAEEPLTLISLLALFPTCLQRIATFKAELKATKILHRDAVVLFAKRIKKLESKLKTKKRKLVLSDSENEEDERQSQELEVLLDLADAALHEQQSSSGLDFPNAAIPAVGRVSVGGADPTVVISAGGDDPAVVISAGGADPADVVVPAGGADPADVVVSASGADSTGTFISAGISDVVGPSVPSAPSSPIRDPTKGKAIATPSSPVTAPSDKELADQQAAIFEAKRQELLEQKLKTKP
nr:hypothetical protein [Tanacetum cinerariifolium]